MSLWNDRAYRNDLTYDEWIAQRDRQDEKSDCWTDSFPVWAERVDDLTRRRYAASTNDGAALERDAA